MTAAPSAAAGSIQLDGIFETHLTVTDLERSVVFYRDVLGLPLAYTMPSRRVAFFWVGAPGRAMLGLWQSNDVLRLHLHFAFASPLVEVLAAPQKLRAVGVTSRGFGREPIETARVIAWMPAAVVYFDDPDGHSLELVAMLDAPARPELGILSWEAWQAALNTTT